MRQRSRICLLVQRVLTQSCSAQTQAECCMVRKSGLAFVWYSAQGMVDRLSLSVEFIRKTRRRRAASRRRPRKHLLLFR